jgi:hypothetical protein
MRATSRSLGFESDCWPLNVSRTFLLARFRSCAELVHRPRYEQRRESFHGAIENGARLVQGKDLLLDQLFESSGANDAASKARS